MNLDDGWDMMINNIMYYYGRRTRKKKKEEEDGWWWMMIGFNSGIMDEANSCVNAVHRDLAMDS